MHNTTMGSTGKGVEYAGLMPGTSVGSFGCISSSPIKSSRAVARLPRRSRAVEKLCRTDVLRRLPLAPPLKTLGEVEGESVVSAELLSSSEGVGGGGRRILVGGVADMARCVVPRGKCKDEKKVKTGCESASSWTRQKYIRSQIITCLSIIIH